MKFAFVLVAFRVFTHSGTEPVSAGCPAKLGHLEQQHINQLWPINPTISAVDPSI